MFKSVIFLFVLLAGVSAQNCRSKWNNFRNCVRNKYNDYSLVKRLDDGARNSMENGCRQCYKNANCLDPFPEPNEANTKRDCYRQARDSLKKQMQNCIKGRFADYDMPDEDDQYYLWMQSEMILKNADTDNSICQPYINRAPLRDCVCSRITQAFGRNNPSRTLCDVRWDCLKTQNMDSSCYDRYQAALNGVCDCSSQINYNNLEDQYATCLSKRQFSVNKEKDYFPKWIAAAKSRYCNNSQKLDSQCGGFLSGSRSGSTSGLAGLNLNQFSSLFNTGSGSASASSALTNVLSGISGLASSTGGLGILGRGSPSSLCSNMAALSSLTNVLGNTDLLKG